MAKNEAKIRFTAETGEFNSAIKKSNDEMSKLRAEMKLNEAQMKSTGASIEGLENKHKILSNQLSVSESKTEALSQKVNKAVEIFGENSTEVNKLRTQLLNAQTAEEKIRQAISACNDELEQQKSAMKQAESASEQLADTINKQQTELNQLKKDYSDAVLQHGKYSKEARDLAKQIDSLSDELNDNQKRMNEVENAADQLDNSLDNLDETAEAVSEGFTVMKGAMSDLVADGIEKVTSGLAEIGTEAFTMANDVDRASNTFIARTGESADSAEKFEGIMTDIYNNNFGESFDDIADSMATVKTNMGEMDDGTLQNMTEGAILLRDTFDFDVNETTRTAKMLMDQFGLSGTDAYNLIAQGAQNGLNKNGDLLDTINEYSVQFKDAGYSAEDMFNMLVNGTETGTWSVDKLGDAVKEFNIRASDGTVGDAIKENAKAFGMTEKEAKALASQVESGSVGAYQKLADKLREVDDDTQRYQLGVSMFGTMWEDLGEEAVFALLDTQGQISTTEDALSKINAVKYDDLGTAIEGIKRNLQTSVSEPIKNEVMPAVNEFIQDVDWEGVGQTIGEVMGVACDAFFAFVDGVKEAVEWMNEHKTLCGLVAAAIGVVAVAIGAYNVVQGIKAAMDAAQVTTIWALVAAHAAQAVAAMAAIAPYVLAVAAIAAVIAIIVLLIKNWDDVVAACKKAWEKVKETLAKWGAWINENVIQPIAKFFSGLWDGITKIFSKIGGWFSEKFSDAKEKATGAWSDAKAKFTKVKDNVTGAFSKVGNWFSDKFSDAKDKATKSWSDAKSKFTKVKNTVTGVFSDVGSWFSKKFTDAKTKSVSAWSDAKSKFNKVKDNCTSAFSNVGSWFSKTFKESKEKALSGWSDAKSRFSTVWNACKSVTSSAWSGIRSTVSSATSNTLSNVSQKWNSIKSATSTAFSNVKSVTSSAFSAVKSSISSGLNSAKSTVSSVLNSIKSKFTSIWNSCKTAVSNAISKIKSAMNFSWSLPKLKLPHIKITGSFSLNPPSVPKFSIDWYKKGAIFTKPTLFNTPYGLKGVGEAGAEAVLPIEKLEDYISGAIEKTQNVVNLNALASAIEDLANRPIVMNVNGREFATATAGDSDSVNGIRNSFLGRGLTL